MQIGMSTCATSPLSRTQTCLLCYETQKLYIFLVLFHQNHFAHSMIFNTELSRIIWIIRNFYLEFSNNWDNQFQKIKKEFVPEFLLEFILKSSCADCFYF